MKGVSTLVAVVLVVVLAGPAAATANASTALPSSGSRLAELEQGTLTSLNLLRERNGLAPLVLSRGLSTAAFAHSRAMLTSGAFQHESADGTSFDTRIRRYYPLAGFDSWSVGENLLYSTGTMSAAAAIATWLASPPHRKNLLSPAWREVGIGAAFASSAGGDFGGAPTMVITMDFGMRAGGTPAVVKHPKAKPATRLAATKGRRVLPLPVAALLPGS